MTFSIPTFWFKSVPRQAMQGSNKLSQTTSRLIDGLEATREELPAIQRSREKLEPVTQSLKIVSGAPPARVNMEIKFGVLYRIYLRAVLTRLWSANSRE